MVELARGLALVAWCWMASAGVGAGGVLLPELDVRRCCPAGHELAPEALQAATLAPDAAAAYCRGVPNALAFAPPVFAPARGMFLESGRVPSHWRVVHSALPACTELRVLPELPQYAPQFALLANNGSLLVLASRRSVPPARYCMDAAATALVCAEDAPPPPELIVPRCCPAEHELAPEALQAAALTPGAAAAYCRGAPHAPPFAPLVYEPVLGSFLDRGKMPAHWHVMHAALPVCAELRVLPEHAAPYALLANNGSLLVRESRRALPPARYCADAAAALVCAEDSVPPPSKCCVEGLAFDGARCVEDSERAAAALAELRALANGSALGFGWPACAGGSRYAEAGALRGSRLAEGGALALAGGAKLPAGAWCAEATSTEAAAGGARVLACEAAARAVRPARSPRHVLYGAGLAVGAAFLAATLVAGFALPAAHHALHWRCQTHYVAALMLGDVLLAATQLAGDSVPPTACRALAVCMHFLFLSAFFWLNTMCFNIWWTFRDFRPTSLERGQEAWRLRVYMVYAWGGPLVVAGAAALLDALPPAAAGAAPFLRPRFAVQRCWFYGDMEILVYFFGPVGVLLLVNLALFVSTTRQLTCGLWRRDEVKSTSERAALGRVCAKLVVVMGVTWGADVVSWAAGGPEYVWYATDLLNALQGVFIFLVVGCQPHAWAALKRCAAACWRRGRGADAGAHSSTHLPSCGESLTHTTAAPAPAPAPAAPTPPAPARIPMETVC